MLLYVFAPFKKSFSISDLLFFVSGKSRLNDEEPAYQTGTESAAKKTDH
jgi:hypothetical protein